MSKNRTERKRQKYLQHLTAIAEAYLKARSVYPPDEQAFLRLAGQKEVDVFHQTMYLVEQGAEKHGYRFKWWYELRDGSWTFEFVDLKED